MFSTGLERILLTTLPFKYLNLSELNSIKTYCKLQTFKEGAVIIAQGKVHDSLYIILEGQAKKTARVLGKHIICLADLEARNFFGELNLLQNLPSLTTIYAKTELECLQLTASYFKMLNIFLPRTHHKITQAIVEKVCFNLKKTYQKIFSTMDTIQIKNQNVSTTTPPTATIFNLNAARISLVDLRNISFFDNFNVEEINTLLKLTTVIKASPNLPLIMEGLKENVFYLVLRGAVQVYITNKDKKAKIAVLAPGQIFGNTSYILREAAFINYTTCERCVLIKITAHELEDMQNHYPTIWNKFYSLIASSFISTELFADKLLVRLNSEFYNR